MHSTPFFLPLNPRGLIDFSGITKPDGTIVEKLYYNSTGMGVNGRDPSGLAAKISVKSRGHEIPLALWANGKSR